MNDHTKRLERSTALGLRDAHDNGMIIAGGSPVACERAGYELNRGRGPIEFYCAAHLPTDALR